MIGRVFCDANVLYPSLLRDLLIRLAGADLVELRWSDEVQNEWIRNLLEHRPDLSPAALERTRQRMEGAVSGARVTGYEPRVPTLSLPDPEDRHVLAAAITGEATHLLTFNLRDFPVSILQPYGITPVHPDAALLAWLQEWPHEVVAVVRRLSTALQRPPMSPQAVADGLVTLSLPVSAERLRFLLESDDTREGL
ncbi:PIN domain-containing protein [Deinococcus budaensis]|uniref:Putative nucleic acid-binding protein n=1 Tax=Deinococcus budaensis TaxID=1665626 RepID=A0A7W8GH54_9DEIO|nr:putative nucleic acid-binding protein [Deinococcus budaensis]